jgi:hypothetical protein
MSCQAYPTLQETSALSSARSTRQSLKNTRQKLCRVWHSAKKARQTVHRQSLLCRVLFLCRLPGSTRQRKAAVTVTETASLPSVTDDTRQRSYLCRVSAQKHSATCGTRQSVPLCRVPETLHSAKNLYRCPGLGSLPIVMVLTLGKEPLCRVLHSAK